MSLRLLVAVTFLLASFAPFASAQVFINEIHYDNTGGDTGEAIEVAAPAGTDLAGCQLVLYNGNGGAPYNTFNLSGTIADQQGGFGTASFPISGIQNGSPDGVALTDASDVVIQFLSYEGSFTATSGPANGLTSTNIGVEEPFDTPVGNSLQQEGTGSDPTAFTWAAPKPNTFGTPNTGQTFSGTPDLVDCGGAPGGGAGSGEIVINEVDYDQPSLDRAEFLELKNVSGADINLGGYVVELINGNGGSAYRTYNLPSVTLGDGAYFVLCGNDEETPNCDLDVSPDGDLIQNGAPDGVLLLNGADLVDGVSYEGSIAGVVEGNGAPGDGSVPFTSISRFPDGADSNDNSADFSLRCTTPGTENAVADSDCPNPKPPEVFTAEIFEIQGTGNASPLEDQIVISEGNVVTALAPDGFFMQTPDSRLGADLAGVDSSNGIFVFTGGAPEVAVGDLVNVTGIIDEFFDFTEYTNNPTVTVVGTDVLPAPVVFDAATPSPDPTTPSCAIEFECYEGMLIEISHGAVTGSNQRFGSDPLAEVTITAAPERTFREPGIEFPGMAGLPVWDGNPEVFELDPNKLGLENKAIPAGSTFSATGVLGFEFGDYEFWPSSLTVDEAPLPRPVRHRRWLETTVGSLNLFRLFDDVDDPPGANAFGEVTDDDGQIESTEEYQRRLGKFAQYIINDLRTPDILAVQEVESLKVLKDLAAEINERHRWARYEAYLVEGNDRGTIDVGFLVRNWRVWFPRVEQLGADETYVEPNGDLDILHDRPPLVLKAWVGFVPINVMVVHNRSLGGIDGSEAERVRTKRFEQAQSIARKVQDIQSSRYGRNLVVIGDFNAFEFSDGYVDALGHIRGDFVPADALLSGEDLVEPDLMNQLMSLPANERYSFVFRGNAQTLDHALTSQSLDYRVRGLEYARGNADAANDLINDDTTSLRASDHDGLVLYLYKGWIKHRH